MKRLAFLLIVAILAGASASPYDVISVESSDPWSTPGADVCYVVLDKSEGQATIASVVLPNYAPFYCVIVPKEPQH